ncbi:helix-turn-helix domain-containing protein [Lonepinella sp. BR2271]|uniref:helix-turn-helix domain-containing protein n=1 Tax=Lonepinella sp. BR2271 TaxID=3434550 RepID=UPI003F6E02B0
MKYRNIIDQQIHEHVTELYELGIFDEKTYREYDGLCLEPPQPKILTSNEICEIREKEGISQGTFAHHLNVSKSLVSAWERGVKKPSGAALKLLNIVQQKGLNAIA